MWRARVELARRMAPSAPNTWGAMGMSRTSTSVTERCSSSRSLSPGCQTFRPAASRLCVACDSQRNDHVCNAERAVVVGGADAFAREAVLAQGASGVLGTDEESARALDQFGEGTRAGVVAVVVRQKHEVGPINAASADGQGDEEGKADL